MFSASHRHNVVDLGKLVKAKVDELPVVLDPGEVETSFALGKGFWFKVRGLGCSVEGSRCLG